MDKTFEGNIHTTWFMNFVIKEVHTQVVESVKIQMKILINY